MEYGTVKFACLEEATEHPLKPVVITLIDGRSAARRSALRSTSTSSSTGTPTPTHAPIPANPLSDPLLSHPSLDGSDPLTQFAREELDPLSKMAADEWDYSNITPADKKSKDTAEELVEPWSVRRSAILSKYTTSEKLSIVTSFLPGGEKVVVKVQPSGPMVDKVKTRLEQLDDFEEGSVRQMLDLSQQQYTARIEQLNNELVQAWHSDQRVKALKIAIQCAKLLVDTSVMAFYPSKFVLITDILDIFGKLVYERLKMKAEYYKPGSKVPTSLPDNFTPDMVPENAKETCRNWFYKIASIRELVPRLYVEMAIIKSYSFLTTSEFNTALLRITRMIRGIGNPLIAVYARCYLCRVGLALFEEVLSRCKKQENGSLLLNTVLTAFKPTYIAARAMDFVNLIVASEDDGYPQYLLYRSLGECLVRESPPKEDCQSVLNVIWKYITDLTDPNKFMHCVEIWIQFTVIHFSVIELNLFFGKIIDRLRPNKAFENYYSQLQNIIEKIVAHTQDFESLLAMTRSVINYLTFCVNRLSVDTRKIVRGHHTRRTSAFVRACAAFCFITIPSLTLVHTRLQLYLLSGQVALLNQCLGQADACFKAALSLVPEMPKTIDIDGRQKSSQPYLLSYLSNFLSTLLVVPDSPEHGVLYLMRGLLNAVQRYFEENTSTKPYLYLRVLDLLSTVAQENYPYHIDKIDSNDKLYGSDQKFIGEVNKICSKIVEEILGHLKYLGSSEQFDKQSALALELFNCFIIRADLRDTVLANMAVNLWHLSQRHGSVDSKVTMRTKAYMTQKSHHREYEHFAEILKKMSR
ncbi:UPF0505 protein C16orf62 like protein [Trachymyrmex septentrionalis]|uniref:UPF0505 protein C16orf62 like protein n=1 Tax=Trachymyrmex septentrionalis TaxID=34720 RepID=A0A195FL24_9HYME|nr:UPF0505 protein C16orf62 like protein [Trachymyrmex septentrionalis]